MSGARSPNRVCNAATTASAAVSVRRYPRAEPYRVEACNISQLVFLIAETTLRTHQDGELAVFRMN